MKTLKPKEILALTIPTCDLGENITIRQYLIELLDTLWVEKEGFSGKRPFGNSGWESDFNFPLIKAGLIKGEILNEDGYEYAELKNYEIQSKEVDALIRDLIRNHL